MQYAHVFNLHPLLQWSRRARAKEAGGASVRIAEPRLVSANDGVISPHVTVDCALRSQATTSRERLINIFMSVFVYVLYKRLKELRL